MTVRSSIIASLLRWLIIVAAVGYGGYILVGSVLHLYFPGPANIDITSRGVRLLVAAIPAGVLISLATAAYLRWYRYLATLLMVPVVLCVHAYGKSGLRWVRDAVPFERWEDLPLVGGLAPLLLTLLPIAIAAWVWYYGLAVIFRFIDRVEGRGAYRVWGTSDCAEKGSASASENKTD